MTATSLGSSTMITNNDNNKYIDNNNNNNDDNNKNDNAELITESQEIRMGNDDTALPISRPDEPNLYDMPKDLRPVYRSLPVGVQVLLLSLSTYISALITWRKGTGEDKYISFLVPAFDPSKLVWTEIVTCIIKSIFITWIATMFLQENFLPTSRVSISTLLEKYHLPSKLSHYETISCCVDNDPTYLQKLGVHYLKYSKPTSTNNKLSSMSRFDAMYLNHGFGASSLSWLPPLPSLVHRLDARVGLGHDAVGFGFTERPKLQNDNQEIALYLPEFSAEIGTNLIQRHLLETVDNEFGEKSKNNNILLMGHSMGSFATLHMALKLPRDTKKTIILVAPALGIRPNRVPCLRLPPLIQTTMLDPLRRYLWFPIAGFILRRLIGTRNFWKTGLQSVWGDSSKVTDSDALRFQWPSIGADRERGVLMFARAMSQTPKISDSELLQKVLELPNTTVSVIVGEKDIVITPAMAQEFFGSFSNYTNIPVIPIAGTGHDPFEEDMEAFLVAVEYLLSTNNNNDNAGDLQNS